MLIEQMKIQKNLNYKFEKWQIPSKKDYSLIRDALFETF